MSLLSLSAFVDCEKGETLYVAVTVKSSQDYWYRGLKCDFFSLVLMSKVVIMKKSKMTGHMFI
jgi:hypothetical protein